ncbi:MAG: hypothetical protein SNJ74_10065 [Fimbriimonadaceae bacterium]
MNRVRRSGLALFALAAVGAVGGLSGCGGPAKDAPARAEASASAPAGTEIDPTSLATFAPQDPPDFSRRSRLALMGPGRRLRVGDPATQALEFFDRPARTFVLRDRPPAFPEEYRSKGWESEAESFAIISYDNRVVLALYTLQGADERTLKEEFLDVYLAEYGFLEPTVVPPGPSARYWFWEDNGHRLMICAARGKAGLTISLAIGDESAMDALRMSPSWALSDRRRADEIWNERRGAVEPEAGL